MVAKDYPDGSDCSITNSVNTTFGSADRTPLINAFDPWWQGEVPLTVLLDPEGKVIYRESGSIDPLTVRRAIVKAMNERKPW